MKIAIVATEKEKNELLAQGLEKGVTAEWLEEPTTVPGANCYIDLLFEHNRERIEVLKNLQPATIIINSVKNSLQELPGNFTRVNGWPTFLSRPVAEVSCTNPVIKEIVGKIFSGFNKITEWVPDVPGFISARVVSMIINEAYFAVADNVSTRDAIDIAMKLGTNYPYGPFEWCKRIGPGNVYQLLESLSAVNSRYKPATLLKQEALHL